MRKLKAKDVFCLALVALFLVMVADGLRHLSRPMPSAPVAFQKALDR